MFKFKTEQSILEKLIVSILLIHTLCQLKKEFRDKANTKGKFPVDVPTSAGQWLCDKEWQRKANPFSRDAEKKRDDLDTKILEKRRNQRILKILAMDQTFKSKAKKPTGNNNY